MSRPQQPSWRLDPASGRYYYYDGATDRLVFQNGYSVPRPSHMPSAAFGNDTQPGSRQNYDEEVQRLADNVTRSSLQQQPEASHSSGSMQGMPKAVHFHDNSSRVRTSYQSGPAESITDPELLRGGIRATRRLIATDGGRGPADEELFEGYSRRRSPRNFFTIGKVFLVLWAEPAGETATQLTAYEPGLTIGIHGQKVFSKVRRFVVIRPSDRYCTCLPITTYNRQGVAKMGVKKSEHSIIFTGRIPPDPRITEKAQRGEEGMRPQAIRVDVDDPSWKLDEMSRLDYGGVHTIQHNIKVKSFGKVNPKSMNALLHQFGNVWNGFPSLAPYPVEQSGLEAEASTRSGASASSAGAVPSSNALGKRRESQSLQFNAPEGTRGRRDTVTSTGDRGSGTRDVSQADRIKAYIQTIIQRRISEGYSAEEAHKFATEKVFPGPLNRTADDQQEDSDAEANDAPLGDEDDSDNAASDANDNDDDDDNSDDSDGHDDQNEDEDGESDADDSPAQGPSRRVILQGALPSASHVAPSVRTSSSTSTQSHSQIQKLQALIQRFISQGYTRDQAVALAKRNLQAKGGRS